MKVVAIIGLGWLGKELAKTLKSKKHIVCGTTTSLAKCLSLNKEYDQVIQYQLGDQPSRVQFEYEIDVCVITIPPSSSDNYATNLKVLVETIRGRNKNIKFIYTSSTSVYGSQPRLVTEESTVEGETENALRIIDFERFVLEKYSDSSCIIRLAGLVGGTRHPVHHLVKKKKVKKPKAAVNLIHRVDVVSFISTLVDHFQSGIFNLVCPDHPTRKEYYEWVAEQKDLTHVLFDEEDKKLDKVVNCIAVKDIEFEFKYSSPYDFPTST